LCNDQGISLGANVLANIENTNKDLEPVDDVFLGLEVEYDLNIFKGYNIIDYNDSKVAKLLNDGHVIGLFQGRSEQGQRGLGNRSLLAHPNHEGILDKVNKIKKREWYRPFACSVLDDQKEKYFNCNFKSPYMLYVFEGKHKLKNIASITNKSRIQTVDKGMRFYDIINEFFKLSKIPYVLNTSLNIPGDPLVENMADLKYMLDNTDLKYVYLPDINKLITK
jgi:carbamoyltransferase